jgi:hypothetical protein
MVPVTSGSGLVSGCDASLLARLPVRAAVGWSLVCLALGRVIDAAYERRSVAVTSNIHPSGFDSIMPKTLATATVDRLLHHAHLVPHQG